MAENMSLADQAVQAIAMVKAMDADVTNENPQRHAVRNLKRLAEGCLADGMRRAIDLAWQAKDLTSLVDDVRKEEAARLGANAQAHGKNRREVNSHE